MKLLIGGSKSKLFHLKEFGNSLEKYGVNYKLVEDVKFCDGFPSRNVENWFQSNKKFNSLIDDFKPDAIFVDRTRHFAKATVETKLPLFVLMRGHYWEETKWAKETLYKYPPKSFAIDQWDKMAKKCFEGATSILGITKFLEGVIKKHYPNKTTDVLYQGINPDNWFSTSGMKLKHPCVGLLQDANIWGKTREMLTLTKVLEAMPDVNFYWVGDGQYREKVLPSLNKFENFTWLGSLNYPEKIRDYLTELDVYGLVSGSDQAPLSLLEAQLMEKPVVATNIWGIPELLSNNNTGFLVGMGAHDEWITKLQLLVDDEKTAKQMGILGRNFVKEKFSWDVIAKKFASILDSSV